MRTHTIRSGQTLSHVAVEYGVSVADIERANPGLNPRRIQVGQSVRVPTPGAVAPSAAPATADPAASTATPPAPEAEPTARTHTIRAGDTLDAISKQYGTTVRALQQANPGLDARRLIPGRTVRIP
jgi:LysM repeat protein